MGYSPWGHKQSDMTDFTCDELSGTTFHTVLSF